MPSKSSATKSTRKVRFGEARVIFDDNHQHQQESNDNDYNEEARWYTRKEISRFKRTAESADDDNNKITNAVLLSPSHSQFRSLNHMESILNLQQYHEETGVHDPKEIASLSMALSKEAKRDAQKIAIQNAIEVWADRRKKKKSTMTTTKTTESSSAAYNSFRRKQRVLRTSSTSSNPEGRISGRFPISS